MQLIGAGSSHARDPGQGERAPAHPVASIASRADRSPPACASLVGRP